MERKNEEKSKGERKGRGEEKRVVPSWRAPKEYRAGEEGICLAVVVIGQRQRPREISHPTLET